MSSVFRHAFNPGIRPAFFRRSRPRLGSSGPPERFPVIAVNGHTADCRYSIRDSIWLVPRLFCLRPIHFAWTSRSGRYDDERTTPSTGGTTANTAASSSSTVIPHG
jgi:hypothetical protein